MDEDFLTIRFHGGPYDGVTFSVSQNIDLPREILFRQASYQPYLDAVYLAENGFDLLDSFMQGEPTKDYHYAGRSEIMDVVNGQARMIVSREDEIRRLQKRFARLQEQLNRSKGAKKAAATRKRRKKNSAT